MRACADVFSKKTGIDVQITTGTPPQWIEQAKQNGDLIFQGAEYMLNDFMHAYPGMIDESSITGLYARSTTILVRKGNPKNIVTPGDLAKPGIKIMVVTQEKMEEVYGRVPGIQYSIVRPVLTGAEAARIWKTVPELDAWITYESWHHALKEETDLVQIPEKERILRITPIAVMTTSRHKRSARAFIDFLKSEDAHKIFQQMGWK
jgi:accessory colonization factor AcfC